MMNAVYVQHMTRKNGFKLLSTSKYDKIEKTIYMHIFMLVLGGIFIWAVASYITYKILCIIEWIVKKIIIL